jgi:hypothetical protein
MTTRTYVTKSGDTYEWEETPEVIQAIQNYWNLALANRNNESKV